jgi:YD repeat-containing protein
MTGTSPSHWQNTITGENMVAIVSGNSLGLSLTSLATGQNAMTGSAALGRQGQNVYVNSANGNLVLQRSDDHLASTGIDLFAVRTYNSQGTFDGDGNDDNWRLGFFRSIDSLTGTLNTTGSTITRTDADGARTIYRYNGGNTYINAEGSGAHDTLSYDAANRQWLWTDGSTRTVETYSWVDGAGKLLKETDASGNRVDFIYTGKQLTEVRDQSGEKQLLIYDGNNLTEIRNVKQDGSVLTRVRYGYDTLNRLQTVTVDLTPEDNSIADGKTYVTTYTYDGDSKRLASVTETDGTQAQFTYKQIGTMWLVDTLTQVVDGVPRTTTYSYGDILNAVPLGAAVDGSLLDTIGDQTVQMNPPVDSSKLTPSEVVTTSHNVGLDSSQLVTNETKTENRTSPLDNSALLTTENAVTRIYAYLNSQAVSTTDPLVVDHVQTLNSSKLLTTDVQGGVSSVALDESKLTTRQPVVEARSATLIDGVLSTTEENSTGAVPPYYRIQAGDTWASITLALYGTQDAEASQKLQALLGSPQLTAGAKLTGLPSTLAYNVVVGQITVEAYYTIGNDDSWANITKTLYGVDDPDAAQALQKAMGSPTLLSGAHLTKFPSVLQYQKHVTVPPYFLVKSGDTWSSIALTLYGAGQPEAGAALQQALAGQTLAPGVHLIGFPAQLSFTTTTITVPGYYRIQADDTWSSIALKLYGYGQPEAGAALQQAMSNRALTVGDKLTPLPSSLTFTLQQVTVPAYYRIQTNDTWQNVVYRVYHTSEPAAAETLRQALGNPSLVAGEKLTGLPQILSYQVTTAVPQYYLVNSGDSWESIVSAVYHTTDPEAALKLKSTMGSPALTAGKKLSGLPATLNYTTSATVILDSTYVIKTGDTWAGITQALYHTAEPAAVAALKAALGSPNLTPGAKLSKVPATLSFAVNATNVSVPPYYRVKQGDTWEGITYALYHTRDQEAVDALRAATGDPQLSAGLQLDGVPATLKYVKVPTTGAETRITDAQGKLTIVTSDSKGRLTKVVGPQVNGVSQSVSYTYDSWGNMLSQTDSMGNTSTFLYDDNGNQTSSTDRMGNLVTRTFNANNQLTSETVRIHTPNAYYSFYGATYFVYDSRNRLRFTVSDGDSVTEYRYDAAGNQSSVIKYTAQAYTSSSFGETDLASWVNGIADKSTIQRTDYAYDFRGQVTSVTAWAKVDATGAGVADEVQVRPAGLQRPEYLPGRRARGHGQQRI